MYSSFSAYSKLCSNRFDGCPCRFNTLDLLAGIQLPKTNQKSSLKVQYHLRETTRNWLILWSKCLAQVTGSLWINLHFSSQFKLSSSLSVYFCWSTIWPSILRRCIHCVSADEKLQNEEAGPNCLHCKKGIF